MTLSLFLCSRMAPFGDKGFRAALAAQFGPGSAQARAYHLHVEANVLADGEDARLLCAKAIQRCDAVLLLLDGSAASTLHRFDAPVLELELMLAAVCAKPVLVLDAAGGQDPLMQLLGSEFFAGPAGFADVSGSTAGAGGRPRLLALDGASPAAQLAAATQVVGDICAGRAQPFGGLSQGQGWERLYLARPDRSARFADDGGNFPFSTQGLLVPPDMTLKDIQQRLDAADSVYPTDTFGALVHAWDAIRALSRTPWAAPGLDAATAHQWLRGWRVWGGAMSWLGLFGHSSAAALMASHASLRLASLHDLKETRPGGPLAPERHHGGLASAYFSLSRLAPSPAVREASRALGIGHADQGLRRARSAQDARGVAGLLAVRGALRLSGGARGLHGLWDLHESERLHGKASQRDPRDAGLATARVQLGAAYKELARRAWKNRMLLAVAERKLTQAHEVLEERLRTGQEANAGQLLMCMKHLVQTRLLQGREAAAHALWTQAMARATALGQIDQQRQLREIGREAGWVGSAHA